MSDLRLSLFDRLSSAVAVLRRLLGRGAPSAGPPGDAETETAPRPKARRTQARRSAQLTPIPVSTPPPAATEPQSALQLLALLQQYGRLIDFLQEDITGFSDQEVGAAARLVHQGCRQTLEEYLAVRPVRDEPEGSRVTLRAGFDASMVRLTGNVVGEAPFTGTLIHRGWQATQVRLPQVAAGYDLKILTAAEVEL
jgi:hypothetical protein